MPCQKSWWLPATIAFKESGIIAISSNDIEKYPQDGPEMMTEFAFKNSFDFPYLYDETQEVAKAFDAACTPDFYLFDFTGQIIL